MPNPIVQEWLSFATRDLKAARVLSHLPGQASTACFHAQQAAEKALKSLYASRWSNSTENP
ncbi:MAG: HEPN domain-containing protein [Sulfobacillus sp.]